MIEKGRRFRFSFTGCWRASSCRRSLAGLASGHPSRVPHPLRRFAPASGIGRLSRLARHRPAGRRGILPRGPLRDKRPRLFRRRFPQRCRRVGAALRTVQRRLLAQTYHHHRQPFRYGNRFRGIYGFPRLSLTEIPRTTAHRRRGSELGRQPAQSRSVYLPTSGDPHLLRQRRSRTQGNCRSDPSLSPQRGNRPKQFYKDVNDYLIAHIKDRPNLPKTTSDRQGHLCRNNLQALKAEPEEIEPPRRKGIKV